MKYALKIRTKGKIAKVLYCCLGIALLIGQANPFSIVFAQEEATQSAVQDTATQSAKQTLGISQTNTTINSSNPFEENEFFTAQNPTPTPLTPTLQPENSGATQQSAVIRQPTSVVPLIKKTYKKDEDISLTVNNAKAEELTIDVLDRQGNSVNDGVTAEKITTGDTTQVIIQPVDYKFKPGKYTIKITDVSGQTFTQDFVWGVLAINTDKSIYLPGEKAHVQMAVLDETGNMVCDAQVSLTIESPTGVTTTFSTSGNTITVTKQCQSHDVSDTPDYEAFYTPVAVGQYNLTLSATTKNGTYTITDGFAVAQSVLFDVSREAPTRIYPPNIYPVTISVKANQNFDGVIQEYVPAGFSVTQDKKSDVAFTSTDPIIKPTSPSLVKGTLAFPFFGSAKVTQGFGDELTDPQEKALYKEFGLKGHDGIDFNLKKDTPVLATDGGEVVLAGPSAYGTTVVIQHQWGKSYYGHLDTILVKVGQQVSRGEEIALSGNSGLAIGEHLHFGIKPNTFDIANGYFGKIDPAPYFDSTSNTKVLGLTSAVVTDGEKILSWKVHLIKGQTVSLVYDFQAPMVSPEFYLLGPAQFFDQNGFVFRESRQWQIASDATNTYFMTSTAGSSPYPTTSWTYATTANASSNVTTFAKNAKNTGFYMLEPGATNSTNLGSTASTLPSTVQNTGWIYTGTNLDGLQTDAGTWTINYKYSVTYTSAPTTKVLWYRVLKVTCASSSCTSNAVISPTDASAPANSGWSQTTIGTLPSSGTLSTAQSLTFSGALTQFATGDKLYVEFAINSNSTGSNSGGWKLEANTSSDNVVTSNVSTPPPVVNQVHYRFRNDDGNETGATWRRIEDTSDNKAYSNGNIRLRVEMSNKTGGSSATGYTYRLEYGSESSLGNCTSVSTWAAVPTSGSTDFNITSSTFVTDATATTAQMTADTTNFVAGQVKTTGNTTSGITLAKTTDYTEIEYSIQPAATVGNLGKAFCFRLTNAGSTTNITYAAYPELIVGQPTINQEHFRFRNDDGGETTTTGNTTYLSPTSDTSIGVFTPTGCTNHFDCLNDNASNAASSGSAPTNDGATTTLLMAAGTERYGLNLSSLPTGYTITGLTVTAYAIDQGNPNTNVTVGYCVTCGGADDTMGTANTVSVASYTAYSSTFSSLSLTGNLGLVLTADSAKASVSTLYVQVTYTAPGASWQAAQDTNVTGIHTGDTLRLRIEAANTGAVSGTRNYKLQYATASGGICGVYSDVPVSTTTEPFEMATSSYFSNGAATTSQLSATGSFVAGVMIANPSNSSGPITMSASSYTENEYMLHVTNNALIQTTYCFQLADTSQGALDVYSQTPELSIIPALSQLMRHGEVVSLGVDSPFTF